MGHSLGAHIAGFTGKTFKDLTGKSIGRISGLDPAGPCFFQEKTDLKLKESDADFVDVIHSDAEVLGLVDPLGELKRPSSILFIRYRFIKPEFI